MNPSTWDRLDHQFASFPIMKASDTPEADEIANAAGTLGCIFYEDYVSFLRRYGGAMVGSLPVFGLRPVEIIGNLWSVVEVTQWFRDDDWPGISGWYIISGDGFGNPIGVAMDGRVMVSDHDAGEISQIAGDFENFLLNCCLKST